jgi:hypothetical protein
MQNEILNSDFILQYQALDAQRDAIQAQINALKENHAKTFPVQPGSKATLKYRDGDSETVAIVALRVSTGTGDISPIFRRVTSDGVSEKAYPAQRGYTLDNIEHGAFPEFMQGDGTIAEFWDGSTPENDNPGDVDYGDGQAANINVQL